MKPPRVSVTLAPGLQILKSEVEPLDSGGWSYRMASLPCLPLSPALCQVSLGQARGCLPCNPLHWRPPHFTGRPAEMLLGNERDRSAVGRRTFKAWACNYSRFSSLPLCHRVSRSAATQLGLTHLFDRGVLPNAQTWPCFSLTLCIWPNTQNSSQLYI